MNLIFTAFATLEGYREGSNANLGSEVFYRCIVVSLVSAKQKNQNCDAALCDQHRCAGTPVLRSYPRRASV